MAVEFHSDRGVTGPGFSATWKKVTIIIIIIFIITMIIKTIMMIIIMDFLVTL